MRSGEDHEGGQATVELAVAIPIFVFLMMLIVQVGVVLFDQLAITNAAREGARVAAVDPDPGSAVAAAARSSRLDPNHLSVSVGRRPAVGGLVSVTVEYRPPIVVPFTDRVLMRPKLTSQAAMRVEKP